MTVQVGACQAPDRFLMLHDRGKEITAVCERWAGPGTREALQCVGCVGVREQPPPAAWNSSTCFGRKKGVSCFYFRQGCRAAGAKEQLCIFSDPVTLCLAGASGPHDSPSHQGT